MSSQDRFTVHNVSRSVHTRGTRAAGAARGLKQFIGGTHRLIRGKALELTEEQVTSYLPELKAKEAAGLIELRDPKGRRVLLNEPGMPVVRSLPPPPLPHPVLDSIANDLNENVGNRTPQFPGGDAPMDDDPNIMPDLVKAAEVEPPPATDFVDTTEAPVVDEPVPVIEEPSDTHTSSKKKKSHR